MIIPISVITIIIWHTIDSSQEAAFSLGHNKMLAIRVHFHDFNKRDVWLEVDIFGTPDSSFFNFSFRLNYVRDYFLAGCSEFLPTTTPCKGQRPLLQASILANIH